MKIKAAVTYYLILILLFLSTSPVYSQIVEIHEFGATNTQWFLYSDGKTWEFTAENDMTIETIETKSVLASVSGTTIHIEIRIQNNLVANWDQYLNDNQYKPYYHTKSGRFLLAVGDIIEYKIYGNSFWTYYAGILGINYVKFTGNEGVEYDIQFTSLTDMNYARFGAGYTFDGNNIYSICGGLGESPYISSCIERYNLINDDWTQFTTGLIPRRYCSAEYISSQNNIYIFNGDTYTTSTYTDTVEIVNVQTGELSYSATNPYPVEYGGSAVWDDKIYLFGGSNSEGYSNRLYEYDPLTDNWTRLADMPEAKQTNGEIIDGILYVFGGYNGSASKRIDTYNIQNSTWTSLGEMPIGISAHATAVYDENVWIIGSYDDIKFLAVYDTETNYFTQLTSDMIGRRHCGAWIVGGKLYSFGGNQASDNSTVLKSLEFAEISSIISAVNNQQGDQTIISYNYPNPFSASTTINFSLQEAELTSIKVFNQLGIEVKSLLNEYLLPGEHRVLFNGSNLPAGVYFYKIQVGEFSVVKKMLLVKQ